MKQPFFSLFVARLLVIQLGLWLGGSAAWAATLSVTPSTISNQSAGMITLAITGLTNGEMVTMEKFLDANTNGVIDGGDLLMQRFQLTDNQVSLIGGATNVNVPGDSNSTGGAITTLLNFERIDLEHIVGSYRFKLSSPSARFTPVTTSFNITNSPYLQSFTGQVRSNGTATALANAIIVVFSTNRNGDDFVGGTVANNSGNYTIKAAPGTYQLAAFKSNFLGDFTASAVTLGAGVTVTTHINAIPATRTISGRVADAGNTNTPLTGSFVVLESNDGLVALTFTDANGNFSAPVTANSWKVRPQDLALHGYVGFQNPSPVDTTAGSVSGVNILLPKGTAMFYGSIKDDLGNPLPGFNVFGQDQGSYQYESDGVTDANGNYAVAALAGNWWSANLSSDDPRLTNYVYSGNNGSTLLTSGQAVRQDFVLKLATNHVTGYVRDNLSNPIVGVSVYAYANINGTNFNAGNALTDGNGNYTLNVFNGTWQVGVSCNGGDNSLTTLGYQCVNNQQVPISGNHGVANFIAQSCGVLLVATTTLPGGSVGSYYNLQVQASGCDQPFTWSLSPGSPTLPSGLNLDGGGNLSGTPNSGGTFNFSVRVTDNTFATADRALSITISGGSPLQVTTTSLPIGTLNTFYSQTVNASGGQPPYHWYLPGGTATLPPGTMSLSDAGILSGTPTAAGTYAFWVGVFDSAGSAVVTQYLSLTINSGSLPLQVTTTSLANGTLNTFYSQTVNASGGQQPYSWSLAPGSAPLPPGLSLASGGTLSGTPTSSGTFFFNVRVTDALSAVGDSLLSINIPTPPLQITTLSLSNSQRGGSYTNQLQAVGGQIPYTWSLAPGSLGLPPNLNLSASGVISGKPATNGTFFFIVRVTDANFTFVNRSLSLTINPKPTLSALDRTGNQFQLRLTGTTGQTYTVQYSTNLANTNWFSLLTTNPSAASITILDPNATNSARYYRARVEP